MPAGKELWRQSLTAGPDKGPWNKVTRDERWQTWKAEGEVEFKVKLDAATDGLVLRVVDGDWVTLGLLAIREGDAKPEAKVRLTPSWDQVPDVLLYESAAPGGPMLGIRHGREWLRDQAVRPWREFAAKGGGVMVGEWGAFQHTPHDVTLRWAEDCLRNWQEAEWGWALWNFRGSFGILDSGRTDVNYEDFEGHKLDRKFLDLLQRY